MFGLFLANYDKDQCLLFFGGDPKIIPQATNHAGPKREEFNWLHDSLVCFSVGWCFHGALYFRSMPLWEGTLPG